ncbi:MAG: winged helix-turn-helix transcriptional regulator [Burkholderiales bacterium]|nr:winged helix-turn-helix transcriptional regulator [Burkholderiales bacterium]
MDAPSCPTPDPTLSDDGPPLKLLGHIHRSFHRMADPLLREHGFAMGHLPVLVALKDGRARSQAELARLAQVEQPSMAQLLARMERDGLVERVPDPDDGRSRLILLTPACRARMHKSRGVMQALSEEALAEFDAAERAELARLIRKLADRVDRMRAERLGD